MSIYGYEALFLLTIIMFSVDLWQTRKKEITLSNAICWTLIWICLALMFNGFIYFFWNDISPMSAISNKEAGTAFFTGFVLEKSLSVDNLFAFAVIFTQFAVPKELRPRVLMIGIAGALILRAVLIFIGAKLIQEFDWILYIFGIILIITGIKLWLENYKDEGDEEKDYTNNLAVRCIRKFFRVSNNYHDFKLFIKDKSGRLVTPMLIVITVIAITDLFFALDSIPAIFAITPEPFLVLSTNIFALLGLRSLYFVLESMLDKFKYLGHALAIILSFIGIKMMLHKVYAIPTGIALGVIVFVLTSAVIMSIIYNKKVN